MATITAEPAAKSARTEYTHTRESFLEAYKVLRDELVNDEEMAGFPEGATTWLREMLEYNVPGGKLNRGMAVYDVLASIKKPEELTKSEIFKANALGWCIEWLQAFFLVSDDIMDGSITRRGQPCWYKVPKVGMVACNDYIMLECCLYRILRTHFSSHPHYQKLSDLFHEVTFQTCCGQMLDLITAPIGSVDLSKYTMDTYMRIVTYKTAFYTFYLPVVCGLVMGGIASNEAFTVARKICLEMGQYFQIQDDVLDCFGDPEVIGKVGTDIQDNKCSWLVCTALTVATEEQKKIITENYGKDDAAAVAAVKALYVELGLEERFQKYEKESYEQLVSVIDGQDVLPRQVFMALLNKIYKRKK